MGFNVCACMCVKRLSIFYQNKEAQHLTRTDYVNDVLAALIPLGFEVCGRVCVQAGVCACERVKEREREGERGG